MRPQSFPVRSPIEMAEATGALPRPSRARAALMLGSILRAMLGWGKGEQEENHMRLTEEQVRQFNEEGYLFPA